jgi:hypothetical protein
MCRAILQPIDFSMRDVSCRAYSNSLFSHDIRACRASPYYYVVEAAPRRVGFGAQP